MLESGSLLSAVMQVWRFDVENDDDVRDAVVADIVDEMEKVTTETPAQGAEENEVTASPPSIAHLCAMFRPIQESAFYTTCPMRVVIFRVLYMCLERRFASQFYRTAANGHYGNASKTSLSLSSDKVLPT